MENRDVAPVHLTVLAEAAARIQATPGDAAGVLRTALDQALSGDEGT
jgi:hypothetical protein